ncbi:MAG: ABC transporter permease [Acidobacteriota bacterium]
MTRTLRRIWNRLLGSFFPSHSDGELSDEIESHIQHMADENIRRGVPPEEARRLARLQFGSVASTKESYRDQRGLPALDTIAQDLRYAFRGIRKNPGFAAIALLSLTVGIGANTAIFSIVNSVLLKPLPFYEPHRVFAALEVIPSVPAFSSMPVNPLHAREWAKLCPSIEQVAIYGGARFQFAAGGEPVSIIGARVPHNVFSLFGVQPILGRAFLAEEQQEGRNRVVILSETTWRERFQADPSIIGKIIVLNGLNSEVAGVVPASFRLPLIGMDSNAVNARPEIYSPLVLGEQQFGPMGNFNYNAMVRLKRGATPEQAVAEMNVVQARFPILAGSKVELKAKLKPIHESVAGRARLGLWMLAGSVGAVLLIVCINLANLLLSRMASRRHEAAIRTALGASRGRQFRLVLTESLLLSLTGGALGILLASWLLQLLVATTTVDLPRLEEVRLDSTVLVFSLCLTVVTAFLFGALPAWKLSGSDPQAALRSGSRSATEGRGGLRLRQGLIGLEVGLSAALLIVAGLLTASLTRLLNTDKGFDVHQVLTVDIRLSNNLYPDDPSRMRFFKHVLAKVEAIPGVRSAGIVTALPTRGETWLDPIYLEGDRNSEMERYSVNNRFASPGYFRAMNIAVRKGRAFEESDRDRSVAVLSEKAARLLWPNEPNPVGRRFIGEDDKPKTLVGITAEVHATLGAEPPPMAYYPFWQRVPAGAYLTVRTSANAGAANAVRAALRSENSQLPIPPITTMEEIVELSVAQRRFQLTLVIVFAIAALLVASFGIYGVVAYSVARRRNEIGIRMALGAQRSQLLSLVVRQGMMPVILGLAGGLVAALLLGRAIRSLLFGIQPADPPTMAGVTLVLLLVGVLACLIPAARASRTDAIAALRME